MRINKYAEQGIHSDGRLPITKRKQAKENNFKWDLMKSLCQEEIAASEKLPVNGRKDICIGIPENINIHIPDSSRPEGAEEVDIRGIAYGGCDKVVVNVLEGYTLKLKFEEASKAGGYGIYAEAKYEDGRTEAYLLREEALTGKEENLIAKAAYEMIKEKNV